MDDMPATDLIAHADAPEGFKLYETRDGLFSNRTGPYFIKGRFPDAVMGVRILEHHCNLNRVAHGGLLMSFMDTVIGRAAAASAQHLCATASLTSHFLRAVPIGSWVEGRAKVLKTGKRAVFLRGDLTCDGELAFTAEGLWQRINVPGREYPPQGDKP